MAFKKKREEGFIVDATGKAGLHGHMTDEEFKEFLASKNQKKTKFDSVVEKAVKWVAAESWYMQEVKKDLTILQAELKAPSAKGWLSFLTGTQSTKLIRKTFKDFRMVGRCERRQNQLDKELEGIIDELKGEVSATGSLYELDALKIRIETEARGILKETSFYEGGITTKLKNIEKLVKQYIPDDDELRVALDELLRDVNKVLEWMNALTIDLQRAHKQSDRYFAALYPKNNYTEPTEPDDDKIVDLLRGEGAYKLYSLDNRRLVWNKWRVVKKKKHGFIDVSLVDATLTGLNLSEFDFRGADLRGADLRGTNLTRANFAQAAMERTKLNGAHLDSTNLGGAILKNAILIKAVLVNCDLSYADLTNANLKGAVITGGSASLAKFANADFTDATVTGTKMDGAIFTGVKLKAAKKFLPSVISLADFRGTGLKSSDLQGVPGVGLAKF